MNTALAILSHALRMLIFDIYGTLRVLMPALLLVLACAAGIALFAPDMMTVLGAEPDVMLAPEPASALIFMVLGMTGLLGYAMMAILWHRHVLLNGAERAEVMRPGPGVFFSYIWRAMVVGMVQLLASVPIAVVVTLLAGPAPGGLMGALTGLLGSLVFIWLALRFSICLPAAAIGAALPLRDSWQATASVSGPLWALALLFSGLNTIFFLLTGILMPGANVVSIVGQTAIYLIEGLLFISVLTTLYGHLMEGRSLGQ